MLDMCGAGSPDDDSVAEFLLEKTVMRDPTQGNFGKSKIVLLGNNFNEFESLEIGLVPVSGTNME